jgi:hypothetical protein
MNKQGYACIVDPDTGLRETDTYTCAHCNKVIHAPVNKKLEEVGDFCRNCMKVICAFCADKRVCTPLMKQIEAMEERDYRRRQMGL